VRVIAGKKRGTRLEAPPDDRIRPTTDRVKEALFGSLQFLIPGAKVLDLFSGSGALGIEAWSRGADEVILADSDAASIAVIRKNYERIGSPGNVKIIKNDYSEVIKQFKNTEKFDIVLIDPPYKSGFYSDVVEKLVQYGLLSGGAVVVMESDGPLEIDADGIEFYKEKKYGATILTYGRYR